MLNQFHSAPWLSCLFVLAFGYMTGMQLGKVSPYVDRLDADFGLGLVYAGWLTSTLAVFVAITASFAGRLIARFGPVTGLKAGAIIMVVGAALFGMAVGPEALLAARAIEAVGYVLAVVAGPAYLAMVAPGRLQAMFLALWGSVVPVGFALANLLASSLGDSVSLSHAFFVFALAIAAWALPILTIKDRLSDRPTAPGTTPLSERRGAIAWAPVVGFGLYVYLSMAFLAFLPAFVQHHAGEALPPSVVALCVPAGSFASAIILAGRRDVSALLMALAGFLSIAVSALAMFASSGVAMVIYAFSLGLCASSLFATVPGLVETRISKTRTIGAIAQIGGATALIAPPIAGSIITHLGWPALTWSFIAVAAIGIAVISLTIPNARMRVA